MAGIQGAYHIETVYSFCFPWQIRMYLVIWKGGRDTVVYFTVADDGIAAYYFVWDCHRMPQTQYRDTGA